MTNLEGIKVIEVATVQAGPMAGRLLADWGADVVHVEHPVRGDMIRAQNGLYGGRRIASHINYVWENYNRNKRSLTLDLSQEDGREVMYKLLKEADVFISNLRPRELEKFKLQYETLRQLNPRLIASNVNGFGKRGPAKNLAGFEHTGYFARAGILHVIQTCTTPPLLNPIGLGDNVAGLALAYGIMTALYLREKTGKGREVDVSLFRSGVFSLSWDISGALVTGSDRQAQDRKDVVNALSNPYQTKDGRWLRLALAQADPYWSRFCRAIEREDLEHDPRFATFEPRIENHTALFAILEETFRKRTLAEWESRFTDADIPWAPIQNLPEVVSDPQAKANDFFISFDHPTYGRTELVGGPTELSECPVTIRMPAPEFSQHTEEILLEIGYTWEDIARFKELGVIK